MKATVMQRVLLVSSAIFVLLITIYASLDFELPAEIAGILIQIVEGRLVHKGSQGHSRCEGLFSDIFQFYDYHGSSAPQASL